MSPRAVRNNNPGNIRIGQPWRGLMPRSQMSPEQAAENEFCVFMSPMWGFRAMATILHTYNRLAEGLTYREAITRWAPPSENNTDAYVASVVHDCNVTPDTMIDFSNSKSMADLCHAISVHECGGWFFKEDDLLHGVVAAH